MISNTESQVMQFGDCPRPEIGDYIEFTHETQSQYNVSWYCSNVVGMGDMVT